MSLGFIWPLAAILAGAEPTNSLYDASALCPRRLSNNDILHPDIQVVDDKYNHSITVRNGTKAPAIVKVVEKITGDVIRFYVAKGLSGTILVNDGTYEVSYAIGGQLLADCETVQRPLHVAMFPKNEELRTEFKEDGYVTGQLELTLYQVSNGNVRAQTISVADFNRD